MYGVAEGFMTIKDRYEDETKLASVGKPPPFFELKVVGDDGIELPQGQVGEIIGRGPILMDGYYKRPDLTSNALTDGWLKTGDVGFTDDDGYLYLSDRKKNLIKSGGVSIYPNDIEEVILAHPRVKETAVFGVPCKKWGETPVAAVTLYTHDEAEEPMEILKQWINDNVTAKFHKISDIFVVESFPTNTAGKIVKDKIKEEYLAEKQ
jgi:acyl-CoA synthetase (AMP-forming)/AMP-acid ligase II